MPLTFVLHEGRVIPLGATPPPLPRIPVFSAPKKGEWVEPDAFDRQLLREVQRLTDKQFLLIRTGHWHKVPMPTSFVVRIREKHWGHEFARRFYLRPAEPQANTEDGGRLLRAVK